MVSLAITSEHLRGSMKLYDHDHATEFYQHSEHHIFKTLSTSKEGKDE